MTWYMPNEFVDNLHCGVFVMWYLQRGGGDAHAIAGACPQQRGLGAPR